MSVFDEINGWNPDEFLSRVPLSTAKDGKSYICPECGKGKGGDGIKPRLNSRGQVKFHCFGACGKDYSNFDVAAAHYGLSNYSLADKAKRLAEIFGLVEDCAGGEDFLSSKSYSTWTAEQKAATSFDTKGAVEVEEKKSASTPEPKTKLYEYCRRHYPLDKFLAERGGKWRGLTAETLNKAGAVYHAEYRFSEGDEQPAIILPYDDCHYFIRAVDGKDRKKSKGSWSDCGLYVAKPINADAYVNLIFEGEIDALSFAQACSLYDYGVVATGSTSNWKKVVPWLEKQFGNAAQKPTIGVCFDNDEAGQEAAKKLADALEAAGYPAVTYFLEEKMAGEHKYQKSDGTIVTETIKKLDANDLLQQGEDKLVDRFLSAASSKETILYASKDRVAERRTQDLERKAREVQALEQIQRAKENQSGFAEFNGNVYFANQFWTDATLTAKYAERKTGFDNLDKQIFLPGLYLLGATPGAGKTTFAWQLLNQLAEAGELCIFCSYEMSRFELFTKSIARELFLSRRAGENVMALSAADIRRGAINNSDVRQVVEDFSFSKAMANLSVRELSNVNVVQLIESLKPICNDAAPVIAVDYLQIIPPTNGRATAKEKIDDIVSRLKDFQRATTSTVILISAFNRASNQNNTPTLEAFRESSAIEYSADVAWLMTTKEREEGMKKHPREVELHCKKNRNGELYTVYFNYYCRNDYFHACAEQDLGDDDA